MPKRRSDSLTWLMWVFLAIFILCIIPMHYHHDRVLSRRVFTLEDLLYYIDPSYPVEYYDGNTMEVGKDTPRQVAVLKDIV